MNCVSTRDRSTGRWRIWLVGGALLTASLAPVFTSNAWAQGDQSTLIAEFKGETAAQTRTPSQWQSDYTKVLEAMLPGMSSDDLNVQRETQGNWERITLHAARPGAEAQRAALVAAMLAKTGAATPQVSRIWLLKMVEWIGRADAVPALVNLLSDADAEIAERARRALANNPSVEATQALRTALKNATAPEKKVAFINALAFRRDMQSAGAIGALAKDANAAVSAQAIAALGQLGGADAIKVLSGLKTNAAPLMRVQIVDALLRAAGSMAAGGNAKNSVAVYTGLLAPTESRNVRMAALRGLALAQGEGALPRIIEVLNSNDEIARNAAARLTTRMTTVNATKVLSAALPKLRPEGQAALMEALGDRGDAGALNAIVAATKSTSEDVRAAAWRALGSVGNASHIALLAKAGANTSGGEMNAARESLARLKGADIDATLMKTVADKSVDAKVRAEIVRALASRRTLAAIPTFLALTGDSDAGLRGEAINAIGLVGTEAHAPAVIAVMSKTKDGGEINAGEKALIEIYKRAARREDSAAPILAAYSDGANAANVPMRASLLRVIGFIGTGASYDAVKAAVKSADTPLQNAGLRALSEWPDDRAIPDLMEIARTTTDQRQHILTLRGVDNLLKKSGKNADEKLQVAKEALQVAKRGDEKQLFIGTLGDVRTLASLQTLQPFLDDMGLRNATAASILKIVKDLRGNNLKEARPAVEKVLTFTTNNDQKRDAQSALDRMK